MEERQEHRKRNPGAVRLTDEQYEEMELLGLSNESAYVNYKLNGNGHLKVSHSDYGENENQHPQYIASQLALQKAAFENKQLREKLEELSRSSEESLNGVSIRVNKMLQEELLRRDYEALKKERDQLSRDVEKLENKLEKTEDQLDEKSQEIEELTKKFGLVELGKTLLPSAISGLARRYPRELKNLAASLGELTGDEGKMLEASGLNEEQQNLLNIAEYFRSLFDDKQFEQLIEIVSLMGTAIKEDMQLMQKIVYYLNQLSRIRKASRNNKEVQSEPKEHPKDKENAGI
jgi:uncharacterized coiled-coil DUF342 family protein